jgi:hypothetical protein
MVKIRKFAETRINGVIANSSQSNYRLNPRELQQQLSLSWTTWTILYPIIQIGDLYIQEGQLDSNRSNSSNNSSNSNSNSNTSITNNNSNVTTTNSTNLIDSSVRAMNEIIQLVVDNAIKDGKFNKILSNSTLASTNGTGQQHHHNPNMKHLQTYYSSLVRYEWETYSTIYKNKIETQPFIVTVMHDLRIGGMFLFVMTILIFGTLTYLSDRRRQRIDKEIKELVMYCQEQKSVIIGNGKHVTNKEEGCSTTNDDHPTTDTNDDYHVSGRWLASNKAVEEMLNASSEFCLEEASGTNNTVNTVNDNDNNNKKYDSNSNSKKKKKFRKIRVNSSATTTTSSSSSSSAVANSDKTCMPQSIRRRGCTNKTIQQNNENNLMAATPSDSQRHLTVKQSLSSSDTSTTDLVHGSDHHPISDSILCTVQEVDEENVRTTITNIEKISNAVDQILESNKFLFLTKTVNPSSSYDDDLSSVNAPALIDTNQEENDK